LPVGLNQPAQSSNNACDDREKCNYLPPSSGGLLGSLIGTHVSIDQHSSSLINLTTIGFGRRICPTCGAQAGVEDGLLVAVRGTFSRCNSPQTRLLADSENTSLRQTAIYTCPTFSEALIRSSPDNPGAWLTRQIDRLLERMRAPPVLRTAIKSLINTGTQNPLLLIPWLSMLYSMGAAAAGAAVAAGIFVGKGIVVLIPLAVHWLKGSIEGDLTGQLVLCAGLVATAEIWVRVSRWHPFLFGLVEMGIGLGVAFFGFRDTQNEFAAFFALIGGAFTIIDGRQRMNKE
jgi:hypothetical protein